MQTTMTNPANRTSLITHLKEAKIFMRIIALVIIFAHTAVIGAPTIDAIQGQLNKKEQNQKSPENELSESFVSAIEKMALLKQLRKENKDTDAVVGDLKTLKKRIKELDKGVLENFRAIKTDLTGKNLDPIILKRHNDMVKHYKDQNKAFMALLNKKTDTSLISDVVRGVNNLIGDNEVTPDELAGDSITDGDVTFRTKDFKRSHQEFDPNNLPTKALQPDKNNKPKTTKQEFILSGLKSSPQMQVAALGDFTFNNLEEATDPLYLAESDEVQLTESIKAKAAELDHDAVKIYHWVRNNIEWLPSWGAIQDAELTLEAQRGNAMDIASLTISLLRASKIPARYVHGTVDVPVEKFKNWAGGFTSWEAAGNYASSAGIPVTSISSGGQVETIRLEHIWVEAATDFHPSRGAKNKDADTWVQLDPSFKQYEFKEGIDVLDASGINMDQLAQDFIDSGTYSNSDSSASGFDSSILENAQEQARLKIESYVASLDDPNGAELLGSKKTIIKEYPVLPSSLPNNIKVVGTRYDKLPNALQQKIEFAFQKDILGNLIDPISFSFSKLNNEKVTLSFKPATSADEDALSSLVPEGFNDLSQLPNSLPSYLINVLPLLNVNGVPVKTGSAINLGEELPLTTGIKFSGRGYLTTPRTYKVIGGSFLNVNVFAGSVSQVKLEALEAKIENTKSILESGNTADLENVPVSELLSDIYYAGGLGYYAQLMSQTYVSGLKSGGIHQLSVGYGTTGYEPKVNSFFGFPRSISAGGLAFDIPMINVITMKDGDSEKTRQFSMQVGALASTLEHMIPEQMLAQSNTSQVKPEAISSIKALQLASLQGQSIYKIDSANMNQILPLLKHDSETLSEIRAALSAGKEVTTHTDAISIPGWSGFGYIIIDPIIGDGAYKISGGSNGGFIALGYIINTLTLFYNALDSVASALKTAPGPLGTIARMLTLSKFMYDVLKTGGDCLGGDVGPVIFVMMLFTIMGLLLGMLITALINPIAAFAAGLAFDAAASWLMGQAQNCK